MLLQPATTTLVQHMILMLHYHILVAQPPSADQDGKTGPMPDNLLTRPVEEPVMIHKNLKKLRHIKQVKHLRVAIFVIAFAFVGTSFILLTRAASPSVAFEVENTTKSGVTTVSDTNASAGSAIKFGSVTAGSGCPAFPAFPDGNCTGWQHTGVTLTNYTGPLTITAANTVIDSKNITGCITVQAANVTIKRSKVSGCSGQHRAVISNTTTTNTLVEDVEIDGGSNSNNIDLAAIGYTDITCRRCNLHHLTKGVHVDGENYRIEDSWIHDLYMPGAESSSPHGEAIYTDYTKNGVIKHNNLDSINLFGDINNSGALAIYNLYDGHDNLLVENNLMNTTSTICLYVGYTHNGDNDLTNVRILNNRFGQKYFPTCATWQPAWSAGGFKPMGWGSSNGNVWSGNTYTNGTVVGAPI